MNGFFDIPSDLQASWWGLIGLHLQEALIPVLFGLLIALPLAQLCARFRWLYPPMLGVTTVLYALPSLAFIVLLINWTGLSTTTVEIPLTIYSLVVLIPAIVDGVRSVPEETHAAATAMGFGPIRRYLQVELPIAVPAIFAGLRVATVSSISLVSVGTLVGIGGLGILFDQGFHTNFIGEIVIGVIISVLLALITDIVLVLIGRFTTPWTRAGR